MEMEENSTKGKTDYGVNDEIGRKMLQARTCHLIHVHARDKPAAVNSDNLSAKKSHVISVIMIWIYLFNFDFFFKFRKCIFHKKWLNQKTNGTIRK
jgi:hypothetical protein